MAFGASAGQPLKVLAAEVDGLVGIMAIVGEVLRHPNLLIIRNDDMLSLQLGTSICLYKYSYTSSSHASPGLTGSSSSGPSSGSTGLVSLGPSLGVIEGEALSELAGLAQIIPMRRSPISTQLLEISQIAIFLSLIQLHTFS